MRMMKVGTKKTKNNGQAHAHVVGAIDDSQRRHKGYTIGSNVRQLEGVDDTRNGRKVHPCPRMRMRQRNENKVRPRNFGLSSPIQLGHGKNVTREKEFSSLLTPSAIFSSSLLQTQRRSKRIEIQCPCNTQSTKAKICFVCPLRVHGHQDRLGSLQPKYTHNQIDPIVK